MERLTIEFDGNYVPVGLCATTPEGEVDDLDGCKDHCEMIGEKCEECAIQKCFDKLGEYEDLEEQGKLLKLPCVVGDTVYVIYSVSPDRHFIHDFEIDALRLTLNTINGKFGKDVFLTREEAEAALKELEEG